MLLRITQKRTSSIANWQRIGIWPPGPDRQGACIVNNKVIRGVTIKQYQYTSGNHKQYELFVLSCYNTH